MTDAKGNNLSDWLINSARKNPEGALLLAAGAVLLLRRTGVAASVGDSELARKSSDTVREAASAAKDYVGSVTAKASDAARDYTTEAQNYARETADSVSNRTAEVAKSARTSLQGTIDNLVREQPLFVALAGLAAGAGVAAAFPTSEVEKRAFEPVSRQLGDAVKYAGAEAKDAVTRATDKVKNIAEERGLTGEGLKKMAADVVTAAAPQTRTSRDAQ